jgi:hypothetical protein
MALRGHDAGGRRRGRTVVRGRLVLVGVVVVEIDDDAGSGRKA